jgi:hypothetical protein
MVTAAGRIAGNSLLHSHTDCRAVVLESESQASAAS